MSFVASLFGMKQPKQPKYQQMQMQRIEAPVIPSQENSTKELDTAAQELREKERMRTGRLSTLVTGGRGVEDSESTQKTLLGS
jgi:hypothetical protein